MHIAESKAFCPACRAQQHIDTLEPKWIKAKGISMRHRCRCGFLMRITCDIKGDFVAYNEKP